MAAAKSAKSTANSRALKKRGPTFKNVLGQPFARYWPQLSDDNAVAFIDLLKRTKESCPALFETKRATDRKPIKYGLSACMRQLKTGRVSTLVVSADLKPRYIVNQIILLAFARNPAVRVLCVPQLNQLLREIVPFACFCMAITSDAAADLEPVVEWCKATVAKHHPKPEDRTVIDLKLYSSIGQSDECSKNAIEMEDVSFERLYLLRKPSGTRSFVPANASDAVTDAPKNDFISLGDGLPSAAPEASSTVDADAISIDNEIRSKLNLNQRPTSHLTDISVKNRCKPNKRELKQKPSGRRGEKYRRLTVLKTQGNDKRQLAKKSGSFVTTRDPNR